MKSTITRFVFSTAVAALTMLQTPVQAGTSDYLGQITLTAATFCPRDTAEANGQILKIQNNSALFSLFGTRYGGDGRTTFALPDMRGRAPIHFGTGNGLTNIDLGHKGGSETIVLKEKNMPAHQHVVSAHTHSIPVHSHKAEVLTSSKTGNSNTPVGNSFPRLPQSSKLYATGQPNAGAMASNTLTIDDSSGNKTNTVQNATTTTVGSGQPVSIRSPYIALRYCINTVGIYPSK